MKKVINLILIMLCIFSTTLYSQDKPKVVIDKSKLVSTKDTVINEVSHKLYVGSSGGRYIIVVSKKTGNEYKRYFPKKK